MQCKDIPTRPIVQFIADLNGEWGNWYSWTDKDTGQFVVPEESIVRALPDGPLPSDEVILEKMSRLIRHGLVDGCDCGCRGDYEITEKGRAYLAREVKK